MSRTTKTIAEWIAGSADPDEAIFFDGFTKGLPEVTRLTDLTVENNPVTGGEFFTFTNRGRVLYVLEIFPEDDEDDDEGIAAPDGLSDEPQRA